MSQLEAMTRRIQRSARRARARLENVLLSLRAFPVGIDRHPLATILSHMLAEVGSLMDMDPEQERYFPTLDGVLASLREASAAIEAMGESTPVVRARSQIAALDKELRALREASIDVLAAMQDRRLYAPSSEAEPPAEPFRASVGVPTLHAVLRAPLRINVDLRSPAPFNEADEIDDSEDVYEEPEYPTPLPALSAEEALYFEHARLMARDCLGDISSLSGLREPLADAPWTNSAPFEERLLSNLDALLALAAEPHGLPGAFSVFEEVQRYARDAPTIDPGREFARALCFASTSGEHALRAVVLALKEAHPLTLPAIGEALSIARHPATAGMMRELASEKDPRLIALSLDVLRFLREARFSDLLPLSAHPDARVRVAAIRTLACVPERHAAGEVLVDALADEDDVRVGLEIAESLLRLSHVEGLRWTRALADSMDPSSDQGLRQGCLRLLAIGGGSRDLERITRILGLLPRDVTLAGFYGHPALVDWLIDTLGAANRVRTATGPWVDPLEIATAKALERITGARPVDEAREVIDYDFAGQPTIFAETWRAYWDACREDCPKNAKLRFGQAYMPALTVRELNAPGLAELRNDLALELAITMGDTGFETSDWVARQRAQLASLEARLSEIAYSPGFFVDARV